MAESPEVQVFYLENEAKELYRVNGVPWATDTEKLAWFIAWAERDTNPTWAVKAFHREESPYEFRVIGQRDQPWGPERLGYEGSPYTIGGWGCVVVSASMMLSQVKEKFVSPSEVNQKMIGVRGFQDYVNFIWGKLDIAYPDTVNFVKYVKTIKTPAPVAEIKQYVDRGDFAICQVDFRPSTKAVDTHFLLITEVSEDLQQAKAADPWTGRIVDIPYAYFNPDWYPKNFGRASMRTAFYKRAS